MTYFETPSDMYAHTMGMTLAQYEAYEDALTEEAETYAGTWAYDGEDATLIPADLVKDADLCTFRLVGNDGWLIISGQDD
jgi:hypothetical protein